jgi:hypothetical protein
MDALGGGSRGVAASVLRLLMQRRESRATETVRRLVEQRRCS